MGRPNKPSAKNIEVTIGGDVSGDVLVAGRDISVTRYSHADRLNQRNREVLLDKVEQFWISGVLKKSLFGAALLDLGMQTSVDSVKQAWELVYETLEDDGKPPATIRSKRVIEAFDQAGGALLMLGAPGSGKTTTLLQLADELIKRAREVGSYPAAVVFNLSTWDGKQTIDKWLTVELNEKYNVPKAIAQIWVKQQEILPLLDGLDETPDDKREKCVEAINSYRADHGMAPLVVCSRLADYQVLKSKLALEGAVIIQSLSKKQVEDYFNTAGKELDAVRELFRRDAVIQELTETPLLLSIITLAYRNTTTGELPTQGSLDERTSHIFETYVNRMFKRRIGPPSYPDEKMTSWLGWLASRMQFNSQTVVVVDRLQPNWLGLGPLRWAYSLGVLVAIWLLQVVILVLVVFTHLSIEQVVVSSSLQVLPNLASYPNLSFVLDVSVVLAIPLALIIWTGSGFGAQIHIMETLGWSWTSLGQAARKHMLRGAFRGAAVGLGLFLLLPLWLIVTGSFRVDTYYLRTLGTLGGILTLTGVIVGVPISIIVGGLANPKIETITAPYDSLRRSTLNGLIVAAILMIVGLPLFLPLIGTLAGNMSSAWTYAFTVLFMILWMLSGGLAVIEHLVLRLVLTISRRLPWRVLRFLDYGADLIFLHKVGAGYIFVHRLLLEHFAARLNRRRQAEA